jgi:hypothetical protein
LIFMLETLPDGRVLTIDRDQASTALRGEAPYLSATGDDGLLIGLANHLSGADRSDRRLKTGETASSNYYTVSFGDSR